MLIMSSNALKPCASKRDSKITVKEMRKKFEVEASDHVSEKRPSFNLKTQRFSETNNNANFVEKKYLKLKPVDLSNTSSSVSNDCKSSHINVPNVPIRRNRKINKQSKVPDVNSNIEGCSDRVSVREKSKLFENKQSEDNLITQLPFGDRRNSQTEPPQKPPRTPTSGNFKIPDINGSTSSTDKVLQKLVDLNLNQNPSTCKPSSVILKSKTPNRQKKLLKPITRSSVPDIQINTGIASRTDTFPSKPKLSVYTNKTKLLKDYFKSLSTAAQNIHDLVKTKQSCTTEDLKSKNVTVLQHKYGTLKKSHSDEHIYEDPYEGSLRTAHHNDGICTHIDELHYMCTPIVGSKFDHRDPNSAAEESKNTLSCLKRSPTHSKESVRKIIYESFSMLRKNCENNESAGENANGDSESDVSVKDVEERITYVKSIKKQMSISSICIAPKLFDAILILNISESGPEVLFKQCKAETEYDYPLVQHLCFPDYKHLRRTEIYTSEWFYFTLINEKNNECVLGYCHRILGWSEEKRGFCRKLPVAICILSSINAPLFYKKILVEIEKHLVLPTNQCMSYLGALQKLGVPNAGASLRILEKNIKDSEQAVIQRPLDSHTVGVELTRCLQLLDVHVLLKAVASLLLERRVLLLSSNAQNLRHCCFALASLIYPFQWQHLLIPVVPDCIAVQCCVDSPYLLGIVTVKQNDILDLLGEHHVFVVDVDKGVILKCFDDEDTILPKKVQKAVICALNLAKNMTDPTQMMRDIMISEAFVHMFVEMLGHYQDHLVEKNNNFTFQKDAFKKDSPSRSIQSFLEWFSETQMFEVFIEECIWRKTYRDICQSQLLTFFEKRIEEYKWELTYNNDKLTRKIVKRVQDFGEKLKYLKK